MVGSEPFGLYLHAEQNIFILCVLTENMEFMAYVIIILVVIGTFGVSLTMLSARFGLIGKKSEVVLGLEKVKEIHDEELRAITDIKNVEIANLQKEKSVLQSKWQRSHEKVLKIEAKNQELIDTEEGSVENLQQNYTINPVKAFEYVKKLGMNPDALSNPALAPMVWEKLNENRDLALISGIIIPKGSEGVNTSLLQKTTETVQQEEIDPIDKLFKELEAQGQTF